MAWIYHPKLDRKVEVPDSAVKVWVHSGWQPAEPPPPPPPVDDQPAPAATPRRRKSEPATPAPTIEE